MLPSELRDLRKFSETYRKLAPLALASAGRVLRDEAAAEDVVQDVFVQLWLRPDSYDPARGSLASYVSMLARSRALDRWRAPRPPPAGAGEARGSTRRSGPGGGPAPPPTPPRAPPSS